MPILDQDTDERRRYYRIEDWVALEIIPSSHPVDNGSPCFQLLNEFRQLEQDSLPLLRQLAEADRLLAGYLRLQSKRLDLLAQLMTRDLIRQMGPPRKVDLSEGGLRFSNPEPFPEESPLNIRLLLLPNPVELVLLARVARCVPQGDGQYEVALHFDHITDAQRQQLARHILQKQALERRKARGEEF